MIWGANGKRSSAWNCFNGFCLEWRLSFWRISRLRSLGGRVGRPTMWVRSEKAFTMCSCVGLTRKRTSRCNRRSPELVRQNPKPLLLLISNFILGNQMWDPKTTRPKAVIVPYWVLFLAHVSEHRQIVLERYRDIILGFSPDWYANQYQRNEAVVFATILCQITGRGFSASHIILLTMMGELWLLLRPSGS